jgi:hypothetical protein
LVEFRAPHLQLAQPAPASHPIPDQGIARPIDCAEILTYPLATYVAESPRHVVPVYRLSNPSGHSSIAGYHWAIAMKLNFLRNLVRAPQLAEITITPAVSENLEKLSPYLRPIGHLPPLITIFGCGISIRGFFRDGNLSPFYYGLCWFVILHFPIIPLRIYLLSPIIDAATGKELHYRLSSGWPTLSRTEYRFHASMSLRDFYEVYGFGLLRFIWQAYLIFLWLLVMLFGLLVALTIFFTVVGLLGDHFRKP